MGGGGQREPAAGLLMEHRARAQMLEGAASRHLIPPAGHPSRGKRRSQGHTAGATKRTRLGLSPQDMPFWLRPQFTCPGRS